MLMNQHACWMCGAVDVIQELRNMRGWIDSNPTKRKTKSGILKFVNGWLARTQNSGGTLKNKHEVMRYTKNQSKPLFETSEERLQAYRDLEVTEAADLWPELAIIQEEDVG